MRFLESTANSTANEVGAARNAEAVDGWFRLTKSLAELPSLGHLPGCFTS